ncbi:MAG TPA: (d)CMP kinase, partial [Gaiellaceae bacterium]|nr:(d)CMP kinase [Gaiellaceae bacterium]
LVAGAAERARRRARERPGEDEAALAAELRARDERDAANTQPARDAVRLDTTDLGVDEVVARIAELVAEARR